MMENKTICAVADLIARQLNHGYNNTHLSLNTTELENIFINCRDKYYYFDDKKLARVLYDANVKSLQARYTDPADMIQDFKYIYSKFPNDVQALKSIQCYCYQTEETSENDHLLSGLRKLADALQSRIISKLPEYQAAIWG